MFEFQRFINILSFILGGALVMAKNQYGGLLSIISLSYHALIHWNPMIMDGQLSEQQTWEDLVKFLGFLGSLILVFTHGHTEDEEDVIVRKVKLG
jgi:hypothetical protein